jgi:hypothetical protein
MAVSDVPAAFAQSLTDGVGLRKVLRSPEFSAFGG